MIIINTMTISLVVTVFILVAILSLGLLVFFKNTKNKTNRLFAMTVFWIVVWMTSNFLENESIDPKLAALFLRIDFASASLLVYSWFLFCLNFPQAHKSFSKIKGILIFIPAIIFVILSFSDLIVRNIEFYEGVIHFNLGKLYPFYVIYAISYSLIGGCGSLIRKYRKAGGLQKIQITYVLLGVSTTALIAVVTNLFLQRMLPVEIFRVGIYGIVFFVGFTTYAILKHHLMNIKVIATEFLVLIISVFSFVQIFLSRTTTEIIAKTIFFLGVLIIGILLVRSVIQEVKRREKLQELSEQLEMANVKLKALDESKSEFISIASHQLRTPLSFIKGNISMALEGIWGKLNPDQKQELEKVYISNEKLIKLVDDLLDISRIESGRMEFKFESLALDKMVENMVKEFLMAAKRKKLLLIYKEPVRPLPKVKADPLKIRQVIMNIIDNAVKYTKEGGVTVGVKEKGNKVIFWVTDTGMGITSQQQKVLFQKFMRAKEVTRVHTEGMGLGLYLAAQLIEAHHGRIWVESEGENKGSTFYFELPVEK